MNITIELDEKLVSQVDAAAGNLHKSRLDYINEALSKSLKDDLKKCKIDEKERKFIESYTRFPQQPEEYEIWQDEQVWENQ